METEHTTVMVIFTIVKKWNRQGLTPLDVDPLALCAAAGLDPTARAETDAVSGFVALANELDRLRAAGG